MNSMYGQYLDRAYKKHDMQSCDFKDTLCT